MTNPVTDFNNVLTEIDHITKLLTRTERSLDTLCSEAVKAFGYDAEYTRNLFTLRAGIRDANASIETGVDQVLDSVEAA